MNWSDVGKKVADFAPMLGTVLGGPAGAGIGSILASKFGTKATPDAVAQAIKSDPDAALKLQEVESNNEVRLQEALLADRQDARATHKDSKMPAALSIGLTIIMATIVYLLFFISVPSGAKEVLFMLLGVVVKEWGGAMQYWFGTTRSSHDKTKLLTIKQ